MSSEEGPKDSDCATRGNACIVGERVIIQAQRIEKTRKRAHGQHRKSWTKADNAKCWIEKPQRNLTRQ